MKKAIIMLLLAAALTGCAAPETAKEPSASAKPTAEATETTAEATEAARTEETIPELTVPMITALPDEEDVPEYKGPCFQTVDVDGTLVDESLFVGHRLVMLNFWEPWCGFCVREMPDLERLSRNYADQGLLVVGIYSNPHGVDEVVEQTGVSYPLLRYTDVFFGYTTNYVPTTVFLGPDGLLVGETYVNACSYDTWAEIVESLL